MTASRNPQPARQGRPGNRRPAGRGPGPGDRRGGTPRRGAAQGRTPPWVRVGIPLGTVVVIVVALVLVKVLGGGGGSSPTTSPSASAEPVPAAVLDHVSNVPAATFDTVGAPSGIPVPSAVKSASPLTQGGKPLVVYVGAEYCPYCAAERWPLVVAMSRFGQFTNLKVTHSGPSPEVYPNTRTFSFVGAGYTSPYLAFSSVETESNIPSGGGYTPLEKPTQLQTQLVTTYDKPPYVASSGGIPFIDYGNRYVTSGASFNPQVLTGLSEFQISDALADPTHVQAQAIDGTANLISAVFCQLTGDQPAAVCTSPGVKAGAARLAAGK